MMTVAVVIEVDVRIGVALIHWTAVLAAKIPIAEVVGDDRLAAEAIPDGGHDLVAALGAQADEEIRIADLDAVDLDRNRMILSPNAQSATGSLLRILQLLKKLPIHPQL